MSLLSTVKPSPQSYPVDVFSVPGHLCFCRRIEIPEDLEKGEEEGFLLLELEGMSPFPLEHLYYGYRLDAAGRYGFVFAAYKRRFEGSEVGGWRRLDAVLPDFLVGLGDSSKAAAPLLLVTPKSLVALAYDDRSELPSRFYAEGRIDHEEAIGRQIETFRQGLPPAFRGFGDIRIWFIDTNPQWLRQSVWLEAKDADGAPQTRTFLNRDALWRADMRDPETVDQAKKDERQNATLWKGVIGVAAVMALLLVGEIIWGASYGYLALRRHWNAERESLVQSIDSKQATANTLRNYLESNLMPFQMIEALMPLQDHPNIIYRRFETQGPDTLVIDAKANNQSQVTAFRGRLERFDKIESVELSNQQNNPQGSLFTTTIHFYPGAFTGPSGTVSHER